MRAPRSWRLSAGPCTRARRPLPRQRETVIANEGANLAATISYPVGKGRFPGVVLVHGSGRMTRDPAGATAGSPGLGGTRRAGRTTSGESANRPATTTTSASGPVPSACRSSAETRWRACARFARTAASMPAGVGFLGSSQAGWIIPAAIAARGAGGSPVRDRALRSGDERRPRTRL